MSSGGQGDMCKDGTMDGTGSRLISLVVLDIQEVVDEKLRSA